MAFAWTMSMLLCFMSVIAPAGANNSDNVAPPANGKLHRILVDTDVDTDDICALLYLLKLNRSEFHLKAITINSNSWSNAGHTVNHVYDVLYMMDRDDIAVGVGGEGGILEDGTILPDVGGYLPIIDQAETTAGDCRYRQSIPAGSKGRLDIDTNFGLRKSFLPQGNRKYTPLGQSAAQQVMIDTISASPTTVLLLGSHTNFAIFLMNNPLLKKNVEHVFIMGGGTHGNLYTAYSANPYAEFNFYQDPFAAYQVIHSGIPITLVPLDATDTIPVTKEFFDIFKDSQLTYEARYCYNSMNVAHDTLFDGQFPKSFSMWDTFTVGVAASTMHNFYKHDGENEFADMKYMNITVVTSDAPYGISDGSNPLFQHRKDKFNYTQNGIHSGHVQTGNQDPFCLVKNDTGRCEDGYTKEVSGPEGVRILVATAAKPNRNLSNPLDRQFFTSFLDVITKPQNSGRFNFTTQFPCYKQILHKPDVEGGKKLGKNVVFDMDMSAGDFLALFYLLKLPVEVINLKAILVTSTGWANAATVDVVYDLLHMMGRDDIPVGLGEFFAFNQSVLTNSNVGNCKYRKAIPQGSGGLLDSDTLYGFSRDLPRSPRRYTAQNAVNYGATEIWESAVKSMDPGSKMTILNNGPLTNLAKIISSNKSISSLIQDVYIIGGNINYDKKETGNVINVPSNIYSEMNMFLDPLAAKTVFESELNITLIPLNVQRKVSAYAKIIEKLRYSRKTPEASFSWRLLSALQSLQLKHHRYQHMETFLGEVLGAVVLAGDNSTLKSEFHVKSIKVLATGDESEDGQLYIDEKQGKSVKVLANLESSGYFQLLANRLNDKKQSAKVGSFEEQRRIWSRSTKMNVCITHV
ncbi:Pyrimidine-specific ribonucleoside hydrolase rihB [Heracleum sosnowskyi]|uniref:Pyrimidine-specific ribonucleoside hydrolase rihB n=1 Tax=Heracleum sosnowskyi TaxID=360622 RepID=A0AAD8GPD4_9APIA|nr:Pyrimidine-specific ribonucleoside hydrolase rihB [Heracleum sosnowskyi]